MEGVSPFDYTQLNTDNILYVGGVPRTLSGYSLFDSPERVSIKRGGTGKRRGEGRGGKRGEERGGREEGREERGEGRKAMLNV